MKPYTAKPESFLQVAQASYHWQPNPPVQPKHNLFVPNSVANVYWCLQVTCQDYIASLYPTAQNSMMHKGH